MEGYVLTTSKINSDDGLSAFRDDIDAVHSRATAANAGSDARDAQWNTADDRTAAIELVQFLSE